MRRHAGFDPASQALTITGSGSGSPEHQRPLTMDAQEAGSIPTGTYTGNALDQIELDSYGGITRDSVWEDHGIPYILGWHTTGSLLVSRAFGSNDPDPTLTLNAGVRVLVEKDFGISIGSDTSNHGTPGALQLLGTADKPVVLSSAEPTPTAGDWDGLVFDEPPGTATNKVDHAVIEYAGSGNSHGG